MLVEDSGKSLKNRAFQGVFNMRFKRQHALGFSQLEHLVHHRQKIDIGIFVVTRFLQKHLERFYRAPDNDFGIGNDKTAYGRAAHNQDFQWRGLAEHGQVSPLQHVADKGTASDRKEPDEKGHRLSARTKVSGSRAAARITLNNRRLDR